MRGVGIVVLVACSKSAPSSPAPVEPPKVVIAHAIAIDAVLESLEIGKVPPLAGTTARIGWTQTLTFGEVTLKYVGSEHAQGRSGSRGTDMFELARGSETAKIDLRRSGNSQTAAELDAFGTLLVLHSVFNDSAYEVTHTAGAMPKPLDSDACMARIVDAATRAKLQKEHPMGPRSLRHGVLEVEDVKWIGYCGAYTQRVWFQPGEPRE